jgi:iron complex outermembrane receptor protein
VLWIAACGLLAVRAVFAAAGPAEQTPSKPITGPAAGPQEPPRAEAAQLEEVVVSGFRRSVEAALQIKRESTGVVDSIVAEDIAKFPDNNLAESIQRVPGVAITRDGGEGKNISVRGLGPDFTRVRINGMEAQAVTDGVTAITRGRNFDFNVFASELFSRIDVQKTAAANVDEGSLGATVDLYTPRPLDFSEPVIAGSLKEGYSELGGHFDPRAALLLSNTWADHTFGALVSLAYSKNNRLLDGVNSGNWDVGTSNGGFCPPALARCAGTNTTAYAVANAVTTWHPRFMRYIQDSLKQDRMGATTTLQWAPAERTVVTLDALFSHLHAIHTEPTMEPIAFSRAASQGGKPEIIVRDAAVDSNGSLTYGAFDNVDMRSEDIYDEYRTNFLQWSLSGKHDFTDRFSIDAMVGDSKANENNYKDLVVQIDRFNSDGYSYDTRTTGATRPAINWGFDVTNPANWYLGPLVTQPGGTGPTGPEIRLRPNAVDNEFKVAQLNGKYDLGAFALRAGLQAKKYTYAPRGQRLLLGEPNTPAIPAGYTLSDLTSSFCGLPHLDVPAGTPRCWLIPNSLAIAQAYNVFHAPPGSRYETSTTVASARGDNAFVQEKDNGAFLQAVFEKKLFGRSLRGDAGVRYVKTKQLSQFFTTVPTTVDPAGFQWTTVERDYNDVLPSLNLSYEALQDFLVRFSAAKVMARPGLNSLSAATSVSVAGGARTVTTGNPFLDPYRSKDYDLSFEWYFAPHSVLSLGLFYKDISTYIQSVTTQAPFSSTGLPTTLLAGTGVTAEDVFTIRNVINTPGGPLKGLEVNYQQPLTFLPGPFAGFGLLLNYTYVKSDISYFLTATGSSTVTAPLLNLSKQAYNATLYYERGGFEARASVNRRDSYLSAIPGSGNAPTNNPPIVVDANGVPATTYVDFSMSYNFSSHLTVSLEGINMTDEFETTFQDTAVQRFQFDRHAGRQYYLGMRFKL